MNLRFRKTTAVNPLEKTHQASSGERHGSHAGRENAAVRWMLGSLFHDQLHLCRGVDDIPNASVSTITS
jgi:hypothetical protein